MDYLSRNKLEWEGSIQEVRSSGAQSAKEKAAPFLGPPFKEAERREVREDFARCRSV